MIINPGSHDPQGPWDPDAKKTWIDTRYFWTLLPVLVVMVGLIVAGLIVAGQYLGDG